MSDLHYVVRNYRAGDFGNYVQLHIEAESLDRAGHCTSPQVLGERLCQPNYSPENDLFISATMDGRIVGYIDVRPELGIGRVVLDCLVHPEHRGRGLATQLFHNAMRRASSMEARLAHVNIRESNVAAKNLLSKLGFRFARHFLELRLELSKVHLPDTEYVALPYRHLRRGEEDELTKIQNRCFAGTWGYHPNTIEEIVYYLSLSNSSPEGIILAWEGDKPVGYCWTTTDLGEHTTGEARKGRIYMIGVDPDYRGRGIARQVLMGGLIYLKKKGIEVVELTVDSENKAACDLYESVGFNIWSTSPWYEKALD